MRKLGTILYNNRYLIGMIFFAVLTFLIIISALNGLIGFSMKEDSKTSAELAKVENDKLEIHTSDDKYIKVDIAKENKRIITEFVELLNNKEYEKAYDYLSDDCKAEVFNNKINNFIQQYADVYVPEKRIIGLDLYKKYNNKDIYNVYLYEDVLVNGKATAAKSSNYIVVDEQDKKIGVNGFIQKFESNRFEEYEDVYIEVLTRCMYVEKDEVKVKVKNNKKDKKIRIAATTNANSIYLQTVNGVKSAASQSEILPYYFEYEPGQEQEFTIKFKKKFDTEDPVKTIVFSEIIEDFDLYKKTNQLDTLLTIVVKI